MKKNKEKLKKIEKLAKKIKEKNITIRKVDFKTLINEYQYFNEKVGISWYYRPLNPFCAARKRIKFDIARSILYNRENHEEYYKDFILKYHHLPPRYLNGLNGKYKKIILKKIIFANSYIKCIHTNHDMIYEAYIKTEL